MRTSQVLGVQHNQRDILYLFRLDLTFHHVLYFYLQIFLFYLNNLS